jgi:diacylglycerol kinase family enzyme
MHRLWFITNTGSGTATEEKCAALAAVFEEHGLGLIGRTRFPQEALPDAAMLDAERVDTVVLFAGDGTVNAALCALSGWRGDFLVLPGGTMNLLARELHDGLDPHAIVRAAHACRRRVALPFVRSGERRAFVGMILGPVASWARAREAVRERRFARMIRAVRAAWTRSFGAGVRLAGGLAMRRGHQAVFVTPVAEGLSVAAVDARDWGSLLELGWSWLTGDWLSARAVETSRESALRLVSPRRALALFDGEPVHLAAGARIERGFTGAIFLATKGAP